MVLMIKYFPKNNLDKFKENITTACLEEYRDLGRMIDLNDDYKVSEVDKAELSG